MLKSGVSAETLLQESRLCLPAGQFSAQASRSLGTALQTASGLSGPVSGYRFLPLPQDALLGLAAKFRRCHPEKARPGGLRLVGWQAASLPASVRVGPVSAAAHSRNSARSGGSTARTRAAASTSCRARGPWPRAWSLTMPRPRPRRGHSAYFWGDEMFWNKMVAQPCEYSTKPAKPYTVKRRILWYVNYIPQTKKDFLLQQYYTIYE